MPKQPSPKLLERMNEDIGAGLPPWHVALQAIDRDHDPTKLLALLQPLVPADVFPHLADLFDRHLRNHPDGGAPRTPSYTLTPELARLYFAVLDVKERPRGVSKDAAIAQAAKRHGVRSKTLRLAVDGSHGGYNRALRRGPPLPLL